MSIQYYYPFMWVVIGVLAAALIAINRYLAWYRKQIQKHPEWSDKVHANLLALSGSEKFLWIFLSGLILSGLAASWYDRSLTNQKIVEKRKELWPVYDSKKIWTAPDPYLAETDDRAELIAYGRDLIANTQAYFGQHGKVKPRRINSLNCQSCHLEAGSKPFGNNYFAVASTYPQLRARSGSLETIPKRINDCFERSLNGHPIDTTSREMAAMVAYMRWLGLNVPKGEKPKGSGLVEAPFLDRAADPAKGKTVYQAQCASCHGEDGQGLPMPDVDRNYPPLWGDMSYNEGAGLFRLSRLAGYVKANMPFGADYQNPILTDEQAWDVAAFINSQPRPKHPFLDTDWPLVEKKPFDHPFGPFADPFPESQHKYGPFQPIKDWYKANQ